MKKGRKEGKQTEGRREREEREKDGGRAGTAGEEGRGGHGKLNFYSERDINLLTLTFVTYKLIKGHNAFHV